MIGSPPQYELQVRRIDIPYWIRREKEQTFAAQPIQDISLLERFRDLEKLDRKDREIAIALVDALITSRQLEQVTRRRRSA